MMLDLLAVVGFGCFVAGIGLQFGLNWALIIGGLMLIVIVGLAIAQRAPNSDLK